MMKYLIIALLSLITLSLNAQQIEGGSNSESAFGNSNEMTNNLNWYFVKLNSDVLARDLQSKSKDELKNSEGIHRKMYDLGLAEVRVFDNTLGLKALEGLVLVYFPDQSLKSVRQQLDGDEEVIRVEQNQVYFTHQDTFNDPSLNSQYAMELIYALDAVGIHTGEEKIKLAIVDDAVFIDHEDLIDNIDVFGSYDVADNDSNPNPPTSGTNAANPDRFSHGTHCAGIAGAVSNNELGIAALTNNKVEIIGIKCTRDNTENTRSIEFGTAGVVKALDNGAKVVSMSWGGPGYSQTLQDIINEATEEHGIVFISSAGNDNIEVKGYPAAYDNVLAVANTGPNDRKAGSSHFGEWIDISAPGVNILSTVYGTSSSPSGYSQYTGTSMSAPMVAGLAAYILSQDPTLSSQEVFDIIKNTADPIDGINNGYEGKLGTGRINVYNAILSTKGDEGIPIAKISTSRTDIFEGQSVTFFSGSLGRDLSYFWTFSEGSSILNSEERSPTVFFQNEGEYTVSLTISNANGSSQVDTTFQVARGFDCGLMNFPLPTTRSTGYSYSNGNGPLGGHNQNNHTAYANGYFFQGGKYVTGALIAFRQVSSNDPDNQFVEVAVYDGEGSANAPQHKLSSVRIPYSEIQTTSGLERNDYTEVVFDSPVEIPESGYFNIAIEISYEAGNNLILHSTLIGDAEGKEAYFRSGSSWSAFGLELQFDMAPIITDVKNLAEGEITVDKNEVCINEDNEVSFDINAIEGISTQTVEWVFEGGNIINSSELNPKVSFSDPGEFKAKARVRLADCAESFVSFEKTIYVTDCSQDPEIDLTSSAKSIPVGQTIDFHERARNVTKWLWTFEGGTPNTSDKRNPKVTYEEEGSYNVKLEVSNPKGDKREVSFDDYVMVYTPGDCLLEYESIITDRRNYTWQDNSFALGHNHRGTQAYANKFDKPNDRMISGGKLWIALALSNTPVDSYIEVFLMDATEAGMPHEIITQKEITFAQLQLAIQRNQGLLEVYFDELIDPKDIDSDDLFFGYKIFYESDDRMNVFGNLLNESVYQGQITFRLENGNWSDFASEPNGGIPLDAAIFPSFTSESVVSSRFELNGEEVADGERFAFEIGESLSLEAINKNGIVYNWYVNDLEFSNPFDSQTALVLNDCGLYVISLKVESNCELAGSIHTIYVEVSNAEINSEFEIIEEPYEEGFYIKDEVLTFDAGFSTGYDSIVWEAPSWFINQISESNILNPEIILMQEGVFEIKLKVFSGKCEDEFSQEITVENASILSTDMWKSGRIQLFPNPASDQLILRLENADIEQVKLDIYTGSGKWIQKVDRIEKYIDVSHLPEGIYIFRLSTNEFVENVKIIKK